MSRTTLEINVGIITTVMLSMNEKKSQIALLSHPSHRALPLSLIPHTSILHSKLTMASQFQSVVIVPCPSIPLDVALGRLLHLARLVVRILMGIRYGDLWLC
jgi:diphthamide synthase subunit DPH2